MPRLEGKEWLAELESREKEKTGIKNLKVKYNKVFGYYLEVTNSFKNLGSGLNGYESRLLPILKDTLQMS